MAYQSRTLAESGRLWWHDMLYDISFIAGYLGIPFEQSNKQWIESSHTPGDFYKKHSRDGIVFKPLIAEKIKRSIGDPKPVGTQKNELCLADVIDNSNGTSPIHASLNWSKRDSMTLENVTSETHGWSACVSIGFEAGTDNAKVIGSLSLTASGEYSKSKAESKTTEIEGGGSIEVDVDQGKIAKLIQTVRSGECEVDVVDEIVLGLGWRVRDYKKRNNKMLEGHAGYARKGHNERWHWDCIDSNDFRTMIEGTNPRYPNVDSKILNDKCYYQINRLLDEKRRTIIVKSKAIFKRGLWGNAKIEYV